MRTRSRRSAVRDSPWWNTKNGEEIWEVYSRRWLNYQKSTQPRGPRKNYGRGSSGATSDRLTLALEMQLSGGRSLGAFRSRANLHRGNDGRHPAFGRDGGR